MRPAAFLCSPGVGVGFLLVNKICFAFIRLCCNFHLLHSSLENLILLVSHFILWSNISEQCMSSWSTVYNWPLINNLDHSSVTSQFWDIAHYSAVSSCCVKCVSTLHIVNKQLFIISSFHNTLFSSNVIILCACRLITNSGFELTKVYNEWLDMVGFVKAKPILVWVCSTHFVVQATGHLSVFILWHYPLHIFPVP